MSEAQRIFMDTNFIVSFLDEKDVLHKKAVELHHQKIANHTEIFLSDVILNEVHSVLARKNSEGKYNPDFLKKFMEKFNEFLQDKPILCLYEILTENYKNVLRLLKESQGRLNFHDCLIAIFLKEVPRVKLVSFDSDFDHVPWIRRIH